MSDLLQIFTGNPLTTFIGKKIEAATKPELESEDWALNMEICDMINENDDDAKDAARAIRKRLQQIEHDRNFTITNRTLTVLETCVSNCSHRFHILVMTKDFIQDLVKLIGPKNNPPIDLQERVLSLIERWAEAFRNQPDLNGVVMVYNDLKAKGVTFPTIDPSSHVPIQTPQRTVPAPVSPVVAPSQRPDRPIGSVVASAGSGNPPAQPVQQMLPGGQILLEGEGYNKITQDLVVVQSSVEMLEDIMRALESPASEGADWKLAEELSITCHQMQDRIVDLIERIANEDLTIELLRLNDELNNVFLKYESLIKKRPVQAPSLPDQEQNAPPAGRERGAISTLAAAATATAAATSQSSSAGVSVSAASADQSQVSTRPKLTGVSSSTLNELSQIDFNATRANTTSASDLPTTQKSSPAKTAAEVDPFSTSGILADSKEKLLSYRLGQLNLLSGDPVGGPKASSAQQGASKASGSTYQTDSGKKLPGNLPEEISSVREQDFAEIENWLSTDSGRDLASIAADMPSMEPVSVPNSEFENFIASRALAGSNASTQQTQPKQQQRPEPSV